MIRTPSTVAMELMYARRDLTSHESAYLASYHRITGRTRRTKIHAERLFGADSGAARAAIWLAEHQEADDLDRALAAFEEAAVCTDPASGMKAITRLLGA
jgi:cystathionine beta-lyase/cystathionine gamma-synthase